MAPIELITARASAMIRVGIGEKYNVRCGRCKMDATSSTNTERIQILHFSALRSNSPHSELHCGESTNG